MAKTVPTIRRANPKILWPDVGDMLRLTMMIAQTNRCLIKKSYLPERKTGREMKEKETEGKVSDGRIVEEKRTDV